MVCREGVKSKRPAVLQEPPWTAIRLVVTVLILGALAWKLSSGEVFPSDFNRDDLVWVIGGLLALECGYVLAAWRWRLVLRLTGHDLKGSRLWSYLVAGMFVSNFLPSTIGGDVLRVSRLSKDIHSTEQAFASVAIDRLSGWAVLPFLAAVGFAVDPDLLRLGNATHVALALLAAALVGLGAVLAIASSSRLAGRFEGHAGWQRFIGAIHTGLRQMRQHPAAALRVILVTGLFQIATVVAYGCACRALGVQVPTAALLAFVPAVNIAQVIPISFGGLGLREFALMIFLRPFGVSEGTATAIGLIVYGMTLIASLVGAPMFMMGGGKRSSTSTVRTHTVTSETGDGAQTE